jgi:hypothetical protein
MHLPATATELNTSARAAEFNVFHDFKGFLDSFLIRWKGHKGKCSDRTGQPFSSPPNCTIRPTFTHNPECAPNNRTFFSQSAEHLLHTVLPSYSSDYLLVPFCLFRISKHFEGNNIKGCRTQSEQQKPSPCQWRQGERTQDRSFKTSIQWTLKK